MVFADRGFNGEHPIGDHKCKGPQRGRCKEEKWVVVTKLGLVAHFNKIGSLNRLKRES